VADSLHDGPLAGADSLIGVEPPELVVSALKRSEDGAALILRAWNIGREPVKARIRMPPFVQGAARVRLDEQPAAADAGGLAWSESDSSILEAPVGAREILTVRLEL
jgi:alpha-mannosidase